MLLFDKYDVITIWSGARKFQPKIAMFVAFRREMNENLFCINSQPTLFHAKGILSD